MDKITIDGSSGGGSVLRVAVPIALAQGKGIVVDNIRGNRPKPGLRTQHLLGLQMISEITGAELTNAYVGSTSIVFSKPEQLDEKHIDLKIDTAASISLILQIALNYSIMAKKNISFSFEGGGTITNWSPPYNYVKHIQKPIFEKVGASIDLMIEKHGFFPKGGAKGKISVRYNANNTFNFRNAKLDSVHVISIASKDLAKANVAERQMKEISKKLKFTTEVQYLDTLPAGTCVDIIANYTHGIPKGFSVLGKRGIKAEKIGRDALKLFNKRNDDASVDEFMADQLLLALAVSKGSSYTIPEMTKHVATNINVIHHILGERIGVEELENCILLKNIL